MRDSVVTERRFGGYVKGSDRCVADVSDFRNDVRITLRTRDMAVRLVVVDEAAVLHAVSDQLRDLGVADPAIQESLNSQFVGGIEDRR